jgi:hemoglobin
MTGECMLYVDVASRRVKWCLRAVCLVLFGLTIGMPRTALSQGDTLYKRVGGYEAIAAIAADFTKGLGTDPVLRPYFFARSDDSRRRILQMFRELLCADAGGPCIYAGRDMTTAHKGLPIGDQEWTALMALWDAILTRHGVEGRNKADMIALFANYRDVIVSSQPR